VAQIVISHAIKKRQMEFDAFVRGVLHYSTSIFGDQFTEDDVWTAVGLSLSISSSQSPITLFESG